MAYLIAVIADDDPPRRRGMCLVLPCRNASSCCFLRCKCNEGSLTQSVSQSTTTEEEGGRGNPQLILAVWEWISERGDVWTLDHRMMSFRIHLTAAVGSDWMNLDVVDGQILEKLQIIGQRTWNVSLFRKWHERKSFIGGRGGPAEDEASSWEIRVSCSFYSRTTRVLIQIYSSSNRERW